MLVLMLVPPALSAIAGPLLGWTNATVYNKDFSYFSLPAVIALAAVWVIDYTLFVYFFLKWFRRRSQAAAPGVGGQTPDLIPSSTALTIIPAPADQGAGTTAPPAPPAVTPVRNEPGPDVPPAPNPPPAL